MYNLQSSAQGTYMFGVHLVQPPV